ncbi:MAG: 4-hydroxy-3-methylbut-2-enyl diphosphate reductase [Oscillospiraceae bacterium]|nr:4-hydroxy-3-methylbut-2-enyl diphosphate reductase [Oscillospiraceae bacterium]
MRVTVAETAGFCYGVSRAVEMAEKAGGEGLPCVMLGPVIHNQMVIQRLADMGVGLVQTVEEVPEGSLVILRSHGESKAIHEALSARGARVVDTTCPFVSRIHTIVCKAQEEGRRVIIIGTPGHPEVSSIAGWWEEPLLFQNAADLEKYFVDHSETAECPITMVSQTTSTQETLKKCEETAKKLCTNLKFFDTICNATCARQSEAQRLASQNDAVVVIGGRNSANTKQLFELCGKVCDNTIWIERAEELSIAQFEKGARVAITAGASTPVWIIKEVYDKMSVENMEIEESFAELLEKSIKTLHTGEKVTGVLNAITPT